MVLLSHHHAAERGQRERSKGSRVAILLGVQGVAIGGVWLPGRYSGIPTLLRFRCLLCP